MNLANMKWQKLSEKFSKDETNSKHEYCYWKWKNLQHSLPQCLKPTAKTNLITL